jgi:hypothetical protein
MKTTIDHPFYGRIEVTKRVPDSSRVRSQRRDQKKREAKRQRKYAGVNTFALMQVLYTGKLTAEELAIMSNGTPAQMKKTLRWIQIQHGVGACLYSPPPELPQVEEVEIPQEELREGNLPDFRSCVAEMRHPIIRSDKHLSRCLIYCICKGARPDELVDLIRSAKPTMPWLECRDWTRKILNQPEAVTDDQLLWLERARKFWNGVRLFGRFFRNAVAARLIRPVHGKWLFVPKDALPHFLPGLSVPKKHQRVEYLIRVTDAEGGRLRILDFYSVEYSPLFRATV